MRRIAFFLIWACAAIWVALVLQGFVAYMTLEPTGSGFTRGSNRIAAFMRWELAALATALVGYIAHRAVKFDDITKHAARMPILLSAGFFLLVLLLFVAALVAARLG